MHKQYENCRAGSVQREVLVMSSVCSSLNTQLILLSMKLIGNKTGYFQNYCLPKLLW